MSRPIKLKHSSKLQVCVRKVLLKIRLYKHPVNQAPSLDDALSFRKLALICPLEVRGNSRSLKKKKLKRRLKTKFWSLRIYGPDERNAGKETKKAKRLVTQCR